MSCSQQLLIIRLYDVKKKKDLGSLIQHNGTITSLCFASKSHMISTGSDGMICIWRIKDWEVIKSIKGHKGPINGISVHPSGKIALTVGDDRTLRLWNLLNGRKASVTKLRLPGQGVQWSSDGQFYGILYDNTIELYDLNEKYGVITQPCRIHCMSFLSSDMGNLLLIGCDDHHLRIFSIKDSELKSEIKGHNARIKSISLHDLKTESSCLVASVSTDGETKLWKISKDLKFEPISSFSSGLRLTCVLIMDATIEKNANTNGNVEPAAQTGLVGEICRI
jgi:protein MAK11